MIEFSVTKKIQNQNTTKETFFRICVTWTDIWLLIDLFKDLFLS